MNSLGDVATKAIAIAKEAVELTPEQREKLQRDCISYDGDVKRAKAELLKLTSLMPSPGTEQDPETRAAMFWDVLKTELSPEHIGAVCRSAMRGSVGGDRFLPTPAQLIGYALKWYQRREPVRKDPRIAGPAAKPLQLRYAAAEHKPIGAEYDRPRQSEDERKRLTDKIRAEMHRANDALRAQDRGIEAPRGNPVIGRKELADMDAGEREKHKIEAEDALAAMEGHPLPKLTDEALRVLERRLSDD